ncbi:3-hydroxybutyryl-CoA dehydrogenase [Fulvivirga imtechensis AK7]|uniref:3-hydroxybutyryl-CoA dehydrogenase n=1 Tax=Fulvivirga imtechensis AK7 TaxID=1237149 RepID=L8JQ66_9BACT|nr:3-hydroxyacyl-CoA dehydrogenase NAD-binding domain-containing protein [Fulvivirga imtechensis]ELR70990.1 3-hydroxybutyryl-CoA dehydrogenase [Fulvivirga imtechensis AK7]
MKSIDDIKSVGVIGAGTMGQGIAQISAMAGYQTILYDIDEKALENAINLIEGNLKKGIEKGKVTGAEKQQALALISTSTKITEVVADFIVEAIVEKLDIKRAVFTQLEQINKEDAILASNTSSIPITQIGAQLKHPDRFVGMHFFNPAYIMKLVEVISGAATSPEVAMLTREFAEKLNKVAVMANDSPGFIVNRVARHFYVEGLKVLEEGVASIETIDTLIQASGFKMGPFQLMDLIGVDTNFSVTTSMFNSFYQDPKFRPSRIQQQKVDAGHHGRKTGKGFYDYK